MKKDYKVFPDVPETFHNSMEDALSQIMEEKPVHRFKKKTKRLLVLVAVMLFGTLTVAAAELFSWHPKIAEKFEAPQELQDVLVVEGVASDAQATCTENGVTVNALQTLQDDQYLYVALEVTIPENMILDENNIFEFAELKIEGIEFGQNGNASMSSGFMDKFESPEKNNSRIYEFYYYESDGFDLDGKTITVTLKNLMGETGKLEFKTIIEGEWQLSWVNQSQNATKHFDVERSYTFSGYDIKIKTVDISPLSIRIVYDGEDIRALEQLEGVNLDQLDSLKTIRFAGVRLKDGSIIDNINSIGSEGYSGDAKAYSSGGMFGIAIDLEQVECLFFGPYDGPYSEIPYPLESN